MDASLVELVEHDRAKVRQQGILLQARRQDSFGGDKQPCAGAEAALEADVPADLLPERPALLVSDTAGNCARCYAPRLQQDDRTVVDQGRGDASGLPRAGRGRHDDGAMCAKTVVDMAEERVNRKRFAHSTHPVIVRRSNLCNS